MRTATIKKIRNELDFLCRSFDLMSTREIIDRLDDISNISIELPELSKISGVICGHPISYKCKRQDAIELARKWRDIVYDLYHEKVPYI